MICPPNFATRDYWMFEACPVCGFPRPIYAFNWNGHSLSCRYAKKIQEIHHVFGNDLEALLKNVMNNLLEDSGVRITVLNLYDNVLTDDEIVELFERYKEDESN